ncbi:uncharacterized protein BKA78DRAFT_25004 [Phyllosticta capitalensis]|uniref:uncharacterized protein n=1 Tax=Phyllosticta capitalensis TaxID=121624 RepID=UPI00313067C8
MARRQWWLLASRSHYYPFILLSSIFSASAGWVWLGRASSFSLFALIHQPSHLSLPPSALTPPSLDVSTPNPFDIFVERLGLVGSMVDGCGWCCTYTYSVCFAAAAKKRVILSIHVANVASDLGRPCVDAREPLVFFQ